MQRIKTVPDADLGRKFSNRFRGLSELSLGKDTTMYDSLNNNIYKYDANLQSEHNVDQNITKTDTTKQADTKTGKHVNKVKDSMQINGLAEETEKRTEQEFKNVDVEDSDNQQENEVQMNAMDAEFEAVYDYMKLLEKEPFYDPVVAYTKRCHVVRSKWRDVNISSDVRHKSTVLVAPKFELASVKESIDIPAQPEKTRYTTVCDLRPRFTQVKSQEHIDINMNKSVKTFYQQFIFNHKDMYERDKGDILSGELCTTTFQMQLH